MLKNSPHALTTKSKRVIQKAAKVTGDLISSKIANKITKYSPENNSDTSSEAEKKLTEIPKERHLHIKGCKLLMS